MIPWPRPFFKKNRAFCKKNRPDPLVPIGEEMPDGSASLDKLSLLAEIEMMERDAFSSLIYVLFSERGSRCE